jgi:hypothetical protein
MFMSIIISKTTFAGELQELPVLASSHGELNLLMVAHAAPVPALAPFTPLGWVYEVCVRPASNVDHCPATSVSYYGGTRLALQQGDTLKIHFVNELPPATHSEHAMDPGEEFLAQNPTNVHTHGLLVSPHYPSPTNPTWGDNVFVYTFNPANGTPVVSPHLHATVSTGSTDYSIKIPSNHPSGLFWFHPHVHGLALNQQSAGLSGLITVGSVLDYLCGNAQCTPATAPTVRHLLMKDTQVLADGTLHDQEEPAFCLAPPPMGPPSAPTAGGPPAPPPAITDVALGQGSCPGQDGSWMGGDDFTGGRWFFSLDGQVYPRITVSNPAGEIWRITNSSASASYDLNLYDTVAKRQMIMQIVSVDGVSVAPVAGSSLADMAAVSGGKYTPVPCPSAGSNYGSPYAPLCVSHIRMMPSARVEVFVTYRDANNNAVTPPAGAAPCSAPRARTPVWAAIRGRPSTWRRWSSRPRPPRRPWGI